VSAAGAGEAMWEAIKVCSEWTGVDAISEVANIAAALIVGGAGANRSAPIAEVAVADIAAALSVVGAGGAIL
jgi:hypothetical protein